MYGFKCGSVSTLYNMAIEFFTSLSAEFNKIDNKIVEYAANFIHIVSHIMTNKVRR